MGYYGSFIVTRRVGGDFKTFPINKKEFLIGKQLTCDVRIYLPQIADNHCKISFEKEGQATLINLSKNGTMVNGEKLGEQDRRALKDQDIITIHDRTFRFEYTSPSVSKPQTSVHLSKPLRPISRSNAISSTPLTKAPTKPFNLTTTPLTNQVKGHTRVPLTEPSKKGVKPISGVRSRINELAQIHQKSKMEHKEKQQCFSTSTPGENHTEDSNLYTLHAKAEEAATKCETASDTINDSLSVSSQILTETHTSSIHQTKEIASSIVDSDTNLQQSNTTPEDESSSGHEDSSSDVDQSSPKLPKALLLLNSRSPKKRKLDTTSLMQPRSPGRRSSKRRPSLITQNDLLTIKTEYTSLENPVSDTNGVVEENPRHKVTFGPDLSPEIYDKTLPPNSPLKRGKQTSSGTPGLAQSKLREEIENSPEVVSVRRVTFGPNLSPEIFDKSLPPNSPLKKGRNTPSAKNTPHKEYTTTRPITPSFSLLKNVLKQFRAKESSPITLDSNESTDESELASNPLNDVIKVSSSVEPSLVTSVDNSDSETTTTDAHETTVTMNNDDKPTEFNNQSPIVGSAEAEDCSLNGPDYDTSSSNAAECHAAEGGDLATESEEPIDDYNDEANPPICSQPEHGVDVMADEEAAKGLLTPEKKGPEISATFTSDSISEGAAIAELFDNSTVSIGEGERLYPCISDELLQWDIVSNDISTSRTSHCTAEITQPQHEGSPSSPLPTGELVDTEINPSVSIQKKENDSCIDDDTQDHDQLPLSSITVQAAPTTPPQTMPTSVSQSESIRQGEHIAELFATPPSKNFSNSPTPMSIDSPALNDGRLPDNAEVGTPTFKPPSVSVSTCESIRQGEAIANLLATPSPKASEEKFYTPDSIDEVAISAGSIASHKSQNIYGTDRDASSAMDAESFIEGEAIAALLSTPAPSDNSNHLPESPLASKSAHMLGHTSTQSNTFDNLSEHLDTSLSETTTLQSPKITPPTSTDFIAEVENLNDSKFSELVSSEIPEDSSIREADVGLNQEDDTTIKKFVEAVTPDLDETMMEVDAECNNDEQETEQGNDHKDDDLETKYDIDEFIDTSIGVDEEVIDTIKDADNRMNVTSDYVDGETNAGLGESLVKHSNQVERNNLSNDQTVTGDEDTLEYRETVEANKDNVEYEDVVEQEVKALNSNNGSIENDIQVNDKGDDIELVFEHEKSSTHQVNNGDELMKESIDEETHLGCVIEESRQDDIHELIDIDEATQKVAHDNGVSHNISDGEEMIHISQEVVEHHLNEEVAEHSELVVNLTEDGEEMIHSSEKTTVDNIKEEETVHSSDEEVAQDEFDEEGVDRDSDDVNEEETNQNSYEEAMEHNTDAENVDHQNEDEDKAMEEMSNVDVKPEDHLDEESDHIQTSENLAKSNFDEDSGVMNHEELHNNEMQESIVTDEPLGPTVVLSSVDVETTPKRKEFAHESSNENEQSNNIETAQNPISNAKLSPDSDLTETPSTRPTRKVNRLLKNTESDIETEVKSRPTRSSKRVTRSEDQDLSKPLASVRTRSTRSTRASKATNLKFPSEETDTQVHPRSTRQKTKQELESEVNQHEPNNEDVVADSNQEEPMHKSRNSSSQTNKDKAEEPVQTFESDTEEVGDTKLKTNSHGKRALEDVEQDEPSNARTRAKKAKKPTRRDKGYPDIDEALEAQTVTRRSKKSKLSSENEDIKPEPTDNDATDNNKNITVEVHIEEALKAKTVHKRTRKNEPEQIASDDELELQMKHITRRAKRTTVTKSAFKTEEAGTISKEDTDVKAETKPKTRRSKRTMASTDEDSSEENVVEEPKITTRRTNRATKTTVRKTRSTRSTKRVAQDEDLAEQIKNKESIATDIPDTLAQQDSNETSDTANELPQPKRASKRTKAAKSSSKSTSKTKTSTKKSKPEVNSDEEAETKPTVTKSAKTTRSKASKATKQEEESEEIIPKRTRSTKTGSKRKAGVEEEEATKPVTRKRAKASEASKTSTRSEDATSTKVSVRQTRSKTRKN